MMEVVVIPGAIGRAKLQSNHRHQQTNIQFFVQAGCPSCRPTNSVKALKGKYHIPWTCLLQTHMVVFKHCLWPLIAPGYLGGGLPCLSSALWCQYPRGLLFKANYLGWLFGVSFWELFAGVFSEFERKLSAV